VPGNLFLSISRDTGSQAADAGRTVTFALLITADSALFHLHRSI
jgi:hypothetical protein